MSQALLGAGLHGLELLFLQVELLVELRDEGAKHRLHLVLDLIADLVGDVLGSGIFGKIVCSIRSRRRVGWDRRCSSCFMIGSEFVFLKE